MAGGRGERWIEGEREEDLSSYLFTLRYNCHTTLCECKVCGTLT